MSPTPHDNTVSGADGRDIMHAGVSDRSASENVANSLLTAAAPELLEALEAAVNRLRERQEMRAGMPGDTNEILAIELACMVAALEEIAAPALAKAVQS